MIPEAEVFLRAETALLSVYAQLRDEHWDTIFPPIFDMEGANKPLPVRQVVNHHVYDDAWIPDMLAGRTMDEVGRDRYDGDLLGDDPHGNIQRFADAAMAAARKADDRDWMVHCGYGDVPAWDYFWQLNIARGLAAHDLARHIGVPSPITEELARGMYEGTAPSADMWHSFGVFRTPVAVAEDASWRDRFLALTGRRP
ncbi:TIGR03086 family protein [Kibdelosporangium persicum]|uniref:TIGR03086 family protein n=1 Tax=Kibdelosporangium persicum TaxID=2698649 RepID=A0ABX2F024_9PSEU|nr:TIGR03086 family protein [Kibdelosporangium persicum]NRN64629.1 hypothetical protein [Kibdelosporangium persicum]